MLLSRDKLVRQDSAERASGQCPSLLGRPLLAALEDSNPSREAVAQPWQGGSQSLLRLPGPDGAEHRGTTCGWVDGHLGQVV